MNKRIGMLTWLVAVLGVVVTGLAAAQEIDSDKPFAEASGFSGIVRRT